MVQMTPEEIAEYRARRLREKEAAEKEAEKEATKVAEDARKQRRTELEVSLKARWLASGGSEAEWFTVKSRIIQDALVAATLAPAEPEPEKPRADAPLSRNQYRN